MKARYSALTGALLIACSGVKAEDGTLAPGSSEFNGTFVTTFQASSDEESHHETLYSLDLTYRRRFDNVGLFAWLEYAKPNKAGGISDNNDYPNADAGTVSKNNSQISEFYLYGGVDSDGEPSWRIGLNEVTTLVDRSALANDEVEQFLSLPLVNNLTIAFPDYALSGFYQDTDAFDQFGYRLVLSSSHGLADNQELANSDTDLYRHLMNVGDDGKGVFAAMELVFDGISYQANIGYWKNSGDDPQAPFGFYAGMDYFVDNGKLNIRYGQADATQGHPEQFVSLAWQQPLYQGELAAGYTFTRFNTAIAQAHDIGDDIMQTAEIYYRKALSEQIYITPAVQWSHGVTAGEDDWLFSLRMEFGF